MRFIFISNHKSNSNNNFSIIIPFENFLETSTFFSEYPNLG